MKAQDIINIMAAQGLSLAGMTEQEFIQGVRANYGCSIATARKVARLTGNY